MHLLLAIENNALTVDQVTAIIERKGVRGRMPTDQVSDQVSDQVKRLLMVFGRGEVLSAAELLARLGLKHLPSFRRSYLKPALAAGLIRMTEPDSPRSPTQRYARAP